jgi:hypothetical protein
LAALLLGLINDPAAGAAMARALEAWDAPHAAELIADRMLALVEAASHGRWQLAADRNGSGLSILTSKLRDDSSRLKPSQQPA